MSPQKQNATSPTTEPSIDLDDGRRPNFEDIEEVEAAIDEKTIVDTPDATFITNTWPALAPVKFEPEVALDLRQAPESDSEENSFNAPAATSRLCLYLLS